MTAITAIITKEWVSCATDSLLTEINPITGAARKIEFKKSKIVPIRKFKAAASYWGLAKVGNWRMYDFLRKISSEAEQYDSFDSFAQHMFESINQKLQSLNISEPLHKGVGIHLIGFERVDQDLLPELYLISNFHNTRYNSVGELALSRNLYKTLPSEFKTTSERLEDRLRKVAEFLDTGRKFIFNNGDPELFNPSANAIHEMFRVAEQRGVMNTDKNLNLRLTSSPIKHMKELQKEFLSTEHIRIGGKVHNLLITNSGHFYSETGDNIF